MSTQEHTTQLAEASHAVQGEICEYKRAEQALPNSEEEMYRPFFEVAPIGVGISDQAGNFLSANPGMESITGYTLKELQTIGIDALCPDPMLRQDLLGTLSEFGQVRDWEVRLKRKDGTTYDAALNVEQIDVAGRKMLLTMMRGITKRKQTEEALRESAERFRLIAETIDEVFWISDVENDRVIYVSPAYERVWGYSQKNLYKDRKSFHDAIHPEDQERVVATLELEKIGRPFDHEYRIIRADGSIRHIWDRGFPIPDETGRVNRYVRVAQDVTAWWSAEEALKESKDYLSQIINCIGDSIFVKDRHYKHVLVNEAMCAWTGKRREELLGKTAHELFPKEEMDSILEQEKLVFETGKECLTEDELTDSQGNRRTVMTKKSLLLDEKGNKQIVGVLRDITERKRAEEALQESEKRYRTAIEHCNDGVAIGKGTITLFVNQRYVEMFGYDRPEEIVGKPASLIAHPDEIKRMEDIMLRRQRGESIPSRYELRGIRKDGEPIDIEISATRTVYGGESVSLAYVRDITERKRAEKEREKLQEQFRQSQKMEAVGVLAGGVAHDFNNLLSVINGYSELLLEGVDRDDPRRSDLEQIKQAGQRAASLTSQLLAFSRKQILHPITLNLDDAIVEMSKMLRRLIGEDIELVCITRPALGLVYADQGQIQQIMMNLVVNARDAMPQGGKLTIETANVDLDENYVRKHAAGLGGPYIMLAISDNGIGMDAATQDRIFEPFFTTKGQGRGTGLGLSTVYGIVKQSNGFIWVYSEPGKGTTFKIYLPRVQGKADELSAGAKVKPDLQGAETVLVVEDESAVRALAARILRERGYTVLEASNGKEALRTAQEFAGEIHLVLTDVVMPEMSGKVLVSQIEIARPGIRALFISGYTNNAIVHHGILESNVAFLQKPFAANVLASKVREVIDSPQAREVNA
jgi:two-component system cell cycle sensor histidine kinase/response regulator CckA